MRNAFVVLVMMALAAAGLCSSVAVAAEPAPATTQAAADPSTPAGAWKAADEAAARGDAEALKQFVPAETPREKKLQPGMMGVLLSRAKLIKSLGRFDPAAVQASAFLKGASRPVPQAAYTIEGERAVFKSPSVVPMDLKRVAGAWRLDLSLPGVNDEVVDQMVAVLAGGNKAVNDTADEISAGKYASPEEAGKVLMDRLVAAAKPPQPSTAPVRP